MATNSIMTTSGQTAADQDYDTHRSFSENLVFCEDVASVVESWLVSATAKVGQTELNSLSSYARRVVASIGGIEAKKVGQADLLAYIKDLADDGLAKRTLTNHLKILRRIFDHCRLLGIRDDNPANGIVIADDCVPMLGTRSRGRTKRSSRCAEPAKAVEATERRPITHESESPNPPKFGPAEPKIGPARPKIDFGLPKTGSMTPKTSPKTGPKSDLGRPGHPSPTRTGWYYVRLGERWAPELESDHRAPAVTA